MAADTEISARLAAHIARPRHDALGTSTLANTRRALLDGIGVMMAASGLSPEVRPFVELARLQAGAREATILGSWERVGAGAAAFANGAQAHALDFEDAYDAAPTHPNASLIPAALALAQSRPQISGRDFLTAMAVGCDISCRMALAAGASLELGPWYPPPILGAFGAVAAAARLLRLDETQIRDAFSLLLCQLACPGEIKHSEHTVIRAVREAFPAQAAVTSVLLAARGVRGFETPLEGRGGFFRLFAGGAYDAAALFARLGEKFYVDDLSFKPWPSCRGTHPYIEAAQELRARYSFEARQIRSIRASIGPVQRMLIEPLTRKRAPSTAIDAKFSIPFTVAAAFVDSEVTLDSFAPAKLTDRELLGVARRVDFDYRDHGFTLSSGALEVTLDDGRQLAAEIPEARGAPGRPLDDASLIAKFVDCATRAAQPLDAPAALALAVRLMKIDTAASFAGALELPAGAPT
jgi:2-methylcitrate dehydratase PrpD